MGLIEPTIRRSKEGQDLLAMLTHKLETLSTKVEDIDIIQSKTLTKLSYFDEFNRKFMEFNASQSLLESKMHHDKQEIQIQYSNIFEQQHTMKEEVLVLEHQRQSMKNDITGISHNLMNAKYDLERKVEGFKEEYRDKLIDIEERLARNEIDTETIHKKIKKNNKEISEIDGRSKISERLCEEHSGLLKNLAGKVENNSKDTKNYFENIRMTNIKISSDLSKQQKLLSSVMNKLKTLEENEVKNRIKMTQPLYNIFTDVGTLQSLAKYDLERINNLEGDKNDSKTLTEEIKSKAEEIMKLPPPLPPKPLSPDSSGKTKKKKRKHKNLPKAKTILNENKLNENS